MSATRMTLEDKQAAIILALRPFLTTGQIQSALAIWTEKYADKPTFALQHFVGECCRLFNIENARSQLLRSLVEELSAGGRKNHSQIEPPRHSAEVTPVNEADGRAVTVFQLVIEQLCVMAGAQHGKNVRHYILANLQRLALDRMTQKSLEMWLTDHMTTIDMAITLKHMQLMVNLAYVALCEYCGPVRADTMLHETIRLVAQHPAARGFAPAQLL